MEVINRFKLLPDEIVLKIMEYLTPEDALGAFWTCKRFANIISSTRLKSETQILNINSDTAIIYKSSSYKFYGFSRYTVINKLIRGAIQGANISCNPLLFGNKVLSEVNQLKPILEFTLLPAEFNRAECLYIYGESYYSLHVSTGKVATIVPISLFIDGCRIRLHHLIYVKTLYLIKIVHTVELPPNLTTLIIDRNMCEDSLYYGCLKSLKVIKLVNTCINEVKLNGSDLTNLEVLEFNTHNERVDLKQFASIKKLSVNYLGSNYCLNTWLNSLHSATLQDMHLILRNLTELEIHNSPYISDIKNLSYIRNIKLVECKIITLIEDIHNMESLTLKGCSIREINNISNINTLRLIECGQLISITNIKTVDNIRISNCRLFREIGNWRMIGMVELRGCPKLIDKTELKNAIEVKIN